MAIQFFLVKLDICGIAHRDKKSFATCAGQIFQRHREKAYKELRHAAQPAQGLQTRRLSNGEIIAWRAPIRQASGALDHTPFICIRHPWSPPVLMSLERNAGFIAAVAAALQFQSNSTLDTTETSSAWTGAGFHVIGACGAAIPTLASMMARARTGGDGICLRSKGSAAKAVISNGLDDAMLRFLRAMLSVTSGGQGTGAVAAEGVASGIVMPFSRSVSAFAVPPGTISLFKRSSVEMGSAVMAIRSGMARLPTALAMSRSVVPGIGFRTSGFGGFVATPADARSFCDFKRMLTIVQCPRGIVPANSEGGEETAASRIVAEFLAGKDEHGALAGRCSEEAQVKARPAAVSTLSQVLPFYPSGCFREGLSVSFEYRVDASRRSAAARFVATSRSDLVPTASLSPPRHTTPRTMGRQMGVRGDRLYDGAEWPPPFSLFPLLPRQSASLDCAGAADPTVPFATSGRQDVALGVVNNDGPSAEEATASQSPVTRVRRRLSSSPRGRPSSAVRQSTSRSPSPSRSPSGSPLWTGSASSTTSTLGVACVRLFDKVSCCFLVFLCPVVTMLRLLYTAVGRLCASRKTVALALSTIARTANVFLQVRYASDVSNKLMVCVCVCKSRFIGSGRLICVYLCFCYGKYIVVSDYPFRSRLRHRLYCTLLVLDLLPIVPFPSFSDGARLLRGSQPIQINEKKIQCVADSSGLYGSAPRRLF